MLASKLATPIHSYTFRLVASAATFGVIGGALALAPAPTALVPPAPTLASPEVLSTQSMPLAADRDLRLVFRAAGATYVKLRDADPMPAHGTPVLHDPGEATGWQTIAIASTAEVPGWRGRSVTVDGTCTAKVVGFAVVGRLTGTADYGPHEAWTADNVLVEGAPVVAAQLDGCDAGIATMAKPFPVTSAPALEARARALLLASPAHADAQRAWRAAERRGDWTRAESAVFQTLVATHPITGVTFVSVHGRIDEGCGGPEINVWGLYRVDGDALVPLQQRALGELHAITRLVDVDADGMPELLGTPWLGTDTIVTTAGGDERARLAVPFFGCAC